MHINRTTFVLALVSARPAAEHGASTSRGTAPPVGYTARRSPSITQKSVPDPTPTFLCSSVEQTQIFKPRRKRMPTTFSLLQRMGRQSLTHEIESYTSGTGTLVAWVEIPSLSSAANTVIYMYYGNAAATSQQNVTGTWNATYRVSGT